MMKILFFAFLIACVSAQTSPEPRLTCIFAENALGYACNIELENADGLDDWQSIAGVHLEGRTNADVTVILSSTGVSRNIPQIICSQFPNLEYLDLASVGIVEVGENSFSGCQNLNWLRLFDNQIIQLPANVFRNNEGLTYLDLDANSIEIIPEGLFAPLVNLETLDLANNFLTNLPGNSFATLARLSVLYLYNCGLTVINPDWFASLTQLQRLSMNNNFFAGIPENAFINLSNLLILDISQILYGGGLRQLHPNAFQGLTNLRQLNLNRVGLNRIDPAWFEPLTSLNYLYLNYNRLEELPPNSFANLEQLTSLTFFRNEIKLLRRNAFGSLATLSLLDLDENGVNAIDEEIIRDAQTLRTLYMTGNVCSDSSFFDFSANRQIFLPRLRNCFCNFLHYVEIVTGDEFQSFRAFEPGMAFRVNGTDNIVITLTPTTAVGTIPRLTVLIGITGGSRSAIRVDGEDVINIPTPNILEANRWTDFRIIWANWMVLVYKEREPFPFLVYNRRQFYNFYQYSVRSPQAVASWNIQPIELPADIDTC